MVLTPCKVARSVLLWKQCEFGDHIYRNFTEGGHEKATSEKLELGALICCEKVPYFWEKIFHASLKVWKSIAYKQIFRNFPTLFVIMQIMRSEMNYAISHWHIIPEALARAWCLSMILTGNNLNPPFSKYLPCTHTLHVYDTWVPIECWPRLINDQSHIWKVGLTGVAWG